MDTKLVNACVSIKLRLNKPTTGLRAIKELQERLRELKGRMTSEEFNEYTKRTT